MTTSVLAQILALLVLTFMSFYIPKTLPSLQYETIALLPPEPLVLRPNPTPPPPPRTEIARPKPLVPKELAAFRAPRFVAPKPLPTPAPVVKTAFQPMPVVSTPQPPKPAPEVKTGVLSAANIPLPETKLPPAKVQTGGFGDPLGQAGTPRAGALTVARLGSFDLPSGSGLGNGTGGSKGAAAVTSAGFGTVKGNSRGNGGGTTVRTGGFGDAGAAQPGVRHSDAPAQPAIIPVEIISKPKPAYTEEARRLRKEGEVILDVVFTASGEVRVLRVVQGLGYGLDESAIAAAKQVRFKPAMSQGRPVDYNAKLHILFELAY